MNLRVCVTRVSLSLFSYMEMFCLQFCVYPCDDPFTQAIANGFPPNRTTPVPNPNAPIFSKANVELAKRGAPNHAGDDLLNPPYAINNTAGVLSDLTVYVGLSLLIYDIRFMDGC
jgi:alpha-glucosidase